MNWEELYTHLVLTMGKDYDYIRDQMDLPRIKALSEYQAKFPPADVGVQHLCRILEAFMGIEENPTPDEMSEGDEEMDILEFAMQFPQG